MKKGDKLALLTLAGLAGGVVLVGYLATSKKKVLVVPEEPPEVDDWGYEVALYTPVDAGTFEEPGVEPGEIRSSQWIVYSFIWEGRVSHMAAWRGPGGSGSRGPIDDFDEARGVAQQEAQRVL